MCTRTETKLMYFVVLGVFLSSATTIKKTIKMSNEYVHAGKETET